MPATAERAAFVAEQFRSATWESQQVKDLYGRVARDTKDEPYESFFDDPLDAQKMLNERGLLIGSHARRFRTTIGKVLLESDLDLSQAVPSATIIDDDLVANMTAAIVAVESIDLDDEKTVLNLWGVIGAAPYSIAEAVGQAAGASTAEGDMNAPQPGAGSSVGTGSGAATGTSQTVSQGAGAAAGGGDGFATGDSETVAAGTGSSAGVGDAAAAGVDGNDAGHGDSAGIGGASGGGESIAGGAGSSAGTGGDAASGVTVEGAAGGAAGTAAGAGDGKDGAASAGPAPTVAEAGTSWTSGSSSTSFNTPYPASGIAVDNIAIIFLLGWNVSSSAPTWTIPAPAGWNLLAGPVDAAWLSPASNSGRIYAFWRRLDGTESGTVTITSSAGVRFRAGRMVIFSGCATAVPPLEDINSIAGPGTGSSDPQGSAITTTGDNRLGVVFIGCDDNTGGLTPPADWSSIWDLVDATSNTHTQGVTKALTAAGSEPAYNPSNLSTGEAWASISFALLPQPPG